MNIINFPKNISVPLKYEEPLPKKRIFYLGVIYTGPALCQDVTTVYLKRHGKKNNIRKWSLIYYGKYDEFDKCDYSIELDFCDEDDVPNMLSQYDIGDHITYDYLRKFGWNGKVYNKAKVIEFKKD